MTRRVVLLLVVLAITIELWLLTDVIGDSESVDQVGALSARAWPYLRWLLVLVVLPAVVVRLLAKGDFICIRRLDIRTFTNLTDDPESDGANAARLLHRFLAPEPGTRRFGRTISRGFSEAKRPTISLSAGVATISLPAVWSHVRQALLGRDIPLYGMLSKRNDTLTVRAWTEDGREVKSETAAEPGTDPLTIAIMRLAEDVKRDLLDLYGEVAEKYQSQLRYEQASETLELAPRPSRKLRLQGASNDLEAHHYEKALGKFSQLAESRRGAFCAFFARLLRLGGYRLRCIATEAVVGQAKALASMGDLSGARELCSSVLARDVDGMVHMALAEIQSYEGAFADAIETYDRAQILVTRSVTGFSLRKAASEVGAIVERAFLRLGKLGTKRDRDIIRGLSALAQLYGARGRLRAMLLSEQGKSDLKDADTTAENDELMKRDLANAVQVLTILSEFMLNAAQFHLERGVRLEDLREFDEAIASYGRCVSACEKELAEGSFTIAPRVDMAWAYTGMSACYSKKMESAFGQSDGDAPTLKVLAKALAELSRTLAPDAVEWLQALKEMFYYPPHTKELGMELDNLAERYLDSFVDVAKQQEEDVGEESPEQRAAGLIADCLAGITGEKRSYPNLAQALRGLVETLRETLAPESIDQVIGGAEMEIANDRVNSQAAGLFASLINESELHLKAEGLYGLSCLYAIEGDNDTAARFLGTVIGGEEYGMQLFGFRNRALLDPDLLALRPDLLPFESAGDDPD